MTDIRDQVKDLAWASIIRPILERGLKPDELRSLDHIFNYEETIKKFGRQFIEGKKETDHD